MEPMNKFLTASANEFKAFVDEICAVSASQMASARLEPQFAAPNQIRSRLPVLSQEGLPSLPFLLDHALSLAQLVDLWVMHARETISEAADDETIHTFHSLCVELGRKSKECLKAAEQAERPDGRSEPAWQQMLTDQRKSITGQNPFEDQLVRSHADADAGITALPQTADAMVEMNYKHVETSAHMGEGDNTPSSSASLGWDRRIPFPPRAAEARAMTNSTNSSTASIEATEDARSRGLPNSRDGPSKPRLFDLMGSSSRRKGKAGARSYGDDGGNEI